MVTMEKTHRIQSLPNPVPLLFVSRHQLSGFSEKRRLLEQRNEKKAHHTTKLRLLQPVCL